MLCGNWRKGDWCVRWLTVARKARGFGGGRFSVEDLADFLREGFQVERFLQESDAAFQNAVAEDAVVGIAGDIENFDFGPRGGDSSGEFATAEPRHHYVGDEDVNRPSVGGGDFERLNTIGCFENTVAGFPEIIADELAYAFLVLHKQDGFGARMGAARCFLRNAACEIRCYLRQKNFECAAMTHFPVAPDDPAALFHYTVHGGETQTGSFSLPLGGEERLEDSRLSAGVHPA